MFMYFIYRDTHIKLEQPDDDESNIVLRMVDEINEAASSSVIDIGSDVMSGIHDDARDDGGDADMLPHYGDPLQMPLSDDVLPTVRDDSEPSTETQPQVPTHCVVLVIALLESIAKTINLTHFLFRQRYPDMSDLKQWLQGTVSSVC